MSFFFDFPDILLFFFEVSILTAVEIGVVVVVVEDVHVGHVTSGVHVGHVGLMHIGVRRDPIQGMFTKLRSPRDPSKLSAAHS